MLGDTDILARLHRLAVRILRFVTSHLPPINSRAWSIISAVTPAVVVWLTFLWTRTTFSSMAHWPPSVVHSALIPLSFALWMAASGLSREHDGNCIAIATAPFVYVVVMLSAIAAAYPPWDTYRSVAIAASLVLVLTHSAGWQATLKVIVREPRAACVALLLGSLLYLYAYLYEVLWQYMAHLASYMVTALSAAFGVSLRSEVITGYGVHLRSSWFGVQVFAPCSGIDGIALGIGLFSVITLLDWRTFRKFELWRLYTVVVLVYFLANAVRIAVLVLAGHIGSHPFTQTYLFSESDREANRAWVRDTVLVFFHEHIGWSFYLLVLYGILRCVYAMPDSSPLMRHTSRRDSNGAI